MLLYWLCLCPEYELWIAFGTRKHFRYLAAHKMAIALGMKKAKALPMFHALTGCDTVSSFVGHGKKTAWSTWNVQPQLTDAMLNCHVHQVAYKKISCIQLRGLSSYSMTGPAHAQTLTRPGEKCLQRRPM